MHEWIWYCEVEWYNLSCMNEENNINPQTQPNTQASKMKLVGGIGFLVAVAVAAFAYMQYQVPASMEPMPSTPERMPREEAPTENNTQKGPTPPPLPDTPLPPPPTSSTAPAEKPVSQKMYKDGTYAAKGAYTSPAGAEHIGITLVLKDDVVTEVKGEVLATHAVSKGLQEKFVAAISSVVIGKKLSDVSIDVVGGASLTSDGFTAAIADIKTQAKV